MGYISRALLKKAMSDEKGNIDRLNKKLEGLIIRQNAITQDIKRLRDEINSATPNTTGKLAAERTKAANTPVSQPAANAGSSPQVKRQAGLPGTNVPLQPERSNIERFIGENLISKLGIAITIIGVSIGVKYSIDYNLITPLMRIILGYLLGIGLLAFGIRLKKSYPRYSAVLVSGSLAIIYFLTFAAYNFYAFIPLSLAFIFMMIVTAFGVLAAINYKEQVIAIIGLVGAYAIPFLLSSDQGDSVIMLSYMSIINIGVLIIAYREGWRLVNYITFGLTWLIFLIWVSEIVGIVGEIKTGLVFAPIFFTIFYLMFLSHKLLKKENFKPEDIVLVLLNSFIFYGFGYALLLGLPEGEKFLGLFTIINALAHLIVALIIRRTNLVEEKLFFFILVLVISFVTIAIPVELKGGWTTMLWSVEAAVLFWIGRTRGVSLYEKLSYPMIGLSFLALLAKWGAYNSAMHGAEMISPIMNKYFLTELVFLLAIGMITYLFKRTNLPEERWFSKSRVGFLGYMLPAVLLFVLFLTIYKEIDLYWINRATAFREADDYSMSTSIINHLKAIWLIIYSLLFFITLAALNLWKIKHENLANVVRILLAISLFIFLTGGLYGLSELREGYLREEVTAYLQHSKFNIIIRYLSAIVFAGALYIFYMHQKSDFITVKRKLLTDIALHIAVLWFASSELLHWLAIGGVHNTYKAGLSILWGSYSLFLIVLGIFYKQKHLRLLAITLFGLTLVKLIGYDLSALSTLKKTVVFLALGILLLIISFLYNKYKASIFEED